MELYKEISNLEDQLNKILGMQIPPETNINGLGEIVIDSKNLLISVSDWLDENEYLNK